MTQESISTNSISHLDVIGVGITIEMFQGRDIWKQIQKNPNGSMLPSSPASYFTERKDKENARQIRSQVAFSAATKEFISNWPIPSISIWPARHQTPDSADKDQFADHIEMMRKAANLTDLRIFHIPPRFNDAPEDVMEKIFQLFDSYPDIPALLVYANDGDLVRELVGDRSREIHCCDGPRRFDSMAESNVAMIFARRDRVDNYIRPFVGNRETHVYAAGPAKEGFKPTQFFPHCWDAKQLDCFDKLPTIATIHRPISVSYIKQSDKQAAANHSRLLSEQQRHLIFKSALDDLLTGIPANPNRIFFDTGGPKTGAHVTPLSMSIIDSLPEFDLFHPDEGIDISQRIGNTGAASPFVMWALAALICQDENEMCVTANLRRREGAMITAITPPAKIEQYVLPRQSRDTTVSPTEQSSSMRIASIGTRLTSGDECIQTGVWRCDPPDATAGDKHFLIAGRRLPSVRRAKNLSKFQKLRGEVDYDIVSATYTLVSYDEP